MRSLGCLLAVVRPWWCRAGEEAPIPPPRPRLLWDPVNHGMTLPLMVNAPPDPRRPCRTVGRALTLSNHLQQNADVVVVPKRVDHTRSPIYDCEDVAVDLAVAGGECTG